jgi:hypothetical protein
VRTHPRSTTRWHTLTRFGLHPMHHMPQPHQPSAHHLQPLLLKRLQDTQTTATMQQSAALTWLDGAPATMAEHC